MLNHASPRPSPPEGRGRTQLAKFQHSPPENLT
ncbi:hypothetical protein CT19431_80182 [Cupriavidus taiwanensis]|nr:hypothetical protein CT19431_80182 [Cupriavidus taiwanensis]